MAAIKVCKWLVTRAVYMQVVNTDYCFIIDLWEIELKIRTKLEKGRLAQSHVDKVESIVP